MSRMETIRNRLAEALNPLELDIRDDSARHQGHAGVDGQAQETHFTVFIISEAFNGLGLVARHRKINELLGDLYTTGLHALAIKATSAEEINAPYGSDA